MLVSSFGWEEILQLQVDVCSRTSTVVQSQAKGFIWKKSVRLSTWGIVLAGMSSKLPGALNNSRIRWEFPAALPAGPVGSRAHSIGMVPL